MIFMSATVFVDTNVLVYARDAGEPRKQPGATRWLQRLWAEQCGRTSTQVLSEYYVTVTRKLDPGLTPDEAWDDVSAYLLWEPQEINRELLLRARDVERRHSLSWWDSMIVAAAQLQNCTLLLTEDLQHGLVCGNVTVRNPFAGEISEARTDYGVIPAPTSRHRPRGRPRRDLG
jgi:predicted nucleic acid-binding protein